MDKAYRKYGDFRRPVVCAVKLFRAYFGNFLIHHPLSKAE